MPLSTKEPESKILTFAWIMNPSDDDDLIPPEAFDNPQNEPELPCSRTLERLYQKREGPPRTKFGRRVFYRRRALRDWLLAQEKEQVRAAGGKG